MKRCPACAEEIQDEAILCRFCRTDLRTFSAQPVGARSDLPPQQERVTVVATTTNGMSIASLVLGLVWLYGIGSILALVFGYMAQSQIRAAGGRQGGNGLAIAGIVLGWVGLGLTIIGAASSRFGRMWW